MTPPTEQDVARIAGVPRYLCAGCGATANADARVHCDCSTNVLYDPDGVVPDAAKDRYFMQQIDDGPAKWAETSRLRQANLRAVRAHLQKEPRT